MTTADPAGPADRRPSSDPTPGASSTTIVRLNVGGVRYETTIKTLVEAVSGGGGVGKG